MNSRHGYVITLQFDASTFETLQALRTHHFPPSINVVPAHLTLLHSATLEQIDRLKQSRVEWSHVEPLSLGFSGVRSLGHGVALAVDSPALKAVRARVMEVMAGQFTRQDQQPFRPHVTIQNKVDRTVAAELLAELSANYSVWEGRGCGLMIWRYLGGPWLLDDVLPLIGAESPM